MKLSKAAAARAALHAVLLPQLAQDSAPVEIRKLTAQVTTAEKLAADAAKVFPDANIDVAALTKSIQFALDEAEEEPKKESPKGKDKDPEPPKAKDEDDEEEEEGEETPKAMDAATIATIRADAKRETMQEMKALREAEADVRPLVGDVAAMDSAEDVYRFAMDSLGIAHERVHPSAFPALISMAKANKNSKQPDVIAMDAAHSSDFAKRFPNAGHVKKV